MVVVVVVVNAAEEAILIFISKIGTKEKMGGEKTERIFSKHQPSIELFELYSPCFLLRA